MAILTYPLNGILYDAEDAEIYNCTRTSGVFASDGHFPASVTGTREVSIGPGLAWMQNEEFHGKAVYNPETVTVTIPEADAYQARIDRIVLRFDKLANQTTLEVLEGTPSSSPKAPSITRDSYVYELGLYTVNVKASSISVADSDVGNTFLDDSVCGIMADAVTNIPTQELYDQWYAWFSEMETDTETLENQFNIWFEQIKEQSEDYMTEIQYEFQVWMNGEKVSFDEWFDTVQDTLDSDTAGKLTNLVNDAQDTADEALEQLATGMVRGFMTDEAEGGEYALLADDSDETHGITLMRPICDCADDASKDLISDEFQENYTYKEGDYCIYDDTLYVFTADKSAGSWDWGCVKATSVGTELANMSEELYSEDTLLATVDWSSGDQTINLDLSEWKYIRIVYSQNSSTGTTGYEVICSTYCTTCLVHFSNWASDATSNPMIQRKPVTVRSTGITATQTVAVAFTSSGCSVNRESSYLGIIAVYGVLKKNPSDDATISPQGFPDDDGDTKTAPGPEIIDPDDDTGGDDNPDDGDDDTKTAPGPEIVDPDDENPDDDDTGTLEPGEVIPDDNEPDDDEPDDTGDDDDPVVGPGPEEVE